MKSQTIGKLAAALNAMQAETLIVVRDKENPFFKSKYADLAAVWDAIRGPLTKNGLSIMQGHDVDEHNNIVLVTTIMHVSGEWCDFRVPLILGAKVDAQGVAAATTYMRRAALAAAVGLAPDDDDDGNSVSSPGAPPAQQKSAPPPPPPSTTGPQKPATAQQTVSAMAATQDPVTYKYRYLNPDLINWLRENTDVAKMPTEKQGSFAKRTLLGILGENATNYQFLGDTVVYTPVDGLMLMLLGRNFNDQIPSDICQWVFKAMLDSRSVVGPDGKYTSQREPNPDYDPGLVAAIAEEYREFMLYVAGA